MERLGLCRVRILSEPWKRLLLYQSPQPEVANSTSARVRNGAEWNMVERMHSEPERRRHGHGGPKRGAVSCCADRCCPDGAADRARPRRRRSAHRCWERPRRRCRHRTSLIRNPHIGQYLGRHGLPHQFSLACRTGCTVIRTVPALLRKTKCLAVLESGGRLSMLLRGRLVP